MANACLSALYIDYCTDAVENAFISIFVKINLCFCLHIYYLCVKCNVLYSWGASVQARGGPNHLVPALLVGLLYLSPSFGVVRLFFFAFVYDEAISITISRVATTPLALHWNAQFSSNGMCTNKNTIYMRGANKQ